MSALNDPFFDSVESEKFRPIPDIIPNLPYEFQGNKHVPEPDPRKMYTQEMPQIAINAQNNIVNVQSYPYIVTVLPTVQQTARSQASFAPPGFSQNNYVRVIDPVYGYRVQPPRNDYYYRSRQNVFVDQRNVQRPYVYLQPNVRVVDQKKDDKKEEEFKDVTVHIGGVLTLPKNIQNNDDLSQSSSSSKEEEKTGFTLPGMDSFKKLARNGCREVEKTIVNYNVKNARLDLEDFCQSVKLNLTSMNKSNIQLEPVLREVILGFLHLSSTWVSLAKVLPFMRDQPHLFDNTLEPVAKEFDRWQNVSKAMLEKMLTALKDIPIEYDKFLAGAYKKSSEYQASVENEEHRTKVQDYNTGYNYDYVLPSNDFQLDLQRLQINPNVPLNHKPHPQWDSSFLVNDLPKIQAQNES